MPQFYVRFRSSCFFCVFYRQKSHLCLCFFQSVQLDLEMRGERLASLTKELEEMATDGRSDADLTALRRAKHDLELKVKDQVSLGKDEDECYWKRDDSFLL